MRSLIALLWFLFFIWALFDILSAPRNMGWKILWMIVCLALPVLGALIYYFFGRPHGV